MPKPSKKVADLRDRLEPAARLRYGQRWIRPLAEAAGIPPATLRTLVTRGQKMPEADVLAALERGAGLTPISAGTAELKAAWQMDGVRDRRAFTALVEALRLVDAKGSDKQWRAAWATIRGAFLVLKELSDFDERHWRRIFGEDGERKPLDHWKTLMQEPEERASSRALDSEVKGGTGR